MKITKQEVLAAQLKNLGFESLDSNTINTTFDNIDESLKQNNLDTLSDSEKANLTFALEAFDGKSIAVTGKADDNSIIGNSVAGSYGNFEKLAGFGLENFTGDRVAVSLELVVKAATEGIGQMDPVVEMFYPTHIGDPKISGIQTSVLDAAIVTNDKRNTNGTILRDSTKSLTDTFLDPNILRSNELELFTVVKTTGKEKNTDKLNVDLKRNIVLPSGEAVETAPILLNKQVDLRSLAITEEELSRGAVPSTLSELGEKVGMRELFLKVADGKILKYDILSHGIEGTATNYGDSNNINISKEIILKIKPDAVFHGTNVRVDSLYTGTKNIEFKVAAMVSLTGNVAEGKILGAITSLEFISAVIDDQEFQLTDAEVADAYNVIKNTAGDSFTPYATLKNSELAKLGTIIDMTNDKKTFFIGALSPVTSRIPVTGENDSAIGQLEDIQANIAKQKITLAGIQKLKDDAAAIKAYYENNGSEKTATDFNGVAGRFTNAWYYEYSCDVSKNDTSNSKDLIDNARGVAVSQLRDVITELTVNTRYLESIKKIFGGKVRIIAGGDKIFASLVKPLAAQLTEDLDDVTVEIKGSDAIEFVDTFYVSFGAPEGVKDGKAFGFGMHGQIPQTPVKFLGQQGDEKKFASVLPIRSTHHNTLPVLAVIKIEGLKKLSGRKGVLQITPEK